MDAPEIIADGIYFPEGLAWSEADQTLLVTSVQQGAVYRVWPEERRKVLVCDTGGGANNLAPALGGGALVTQNGGLNAYPGMIKSFPDLGPWPEIRPRQPGLVHVDRDGAADYVITSRAGSADYDPESDIDTPNDIVVAADGTAYFTDPGNPFLERPRDPRVMALAPDGCVRTVARGFHYCNGIEVETDQSLLVTDHEGLLRVHLDGRVEWIAKGIAAPAPDGVAVDSAGRVYVAATRESGVRVLEGAEPVEFLTAPGNGSTSNCCFGGPDYTWLFATDTRNGTIIRWTSMPTPGRAPNQWTPQRT